ncbi:MAG TPA: hypothetical protein VJ280_08060 [Dehalococcoidales bacterium]|jgi:hypothetical protein|nr:hypothetical protein [Dehalococcoidales bacterium]
MAEELGKIEKLDIEQFGLRKLYVVPLLFSGSDAPADYKEKLEKYWREVNEQIANQEVKVGKIKRIYHESMSAGGAEGLKIIAEINPLSHLIAKDKFESGAVFEATELAELADECIDWERCLLMGLYSRKALEMVAEAYEKCSVKRFEYIGRRIDETLQKGEAAMLFIREGHMVHFAKDIEVFSVAPPALDDIHRWLRDRSKQTEEKDEEKKN